MDIVIAVPPQVEARLFGTLIPRWRYEGPDDSQAKINFIRQHLVDYLNDEVFKVEEAQAQDQARRQPPALT